MGTNKDKQKIQMSVNIPPGAYTTSVVAFLEVKRVIYRVEQTPSYRGLQKVKNKIFN